MFSAILAAIIAPPAACDESVFLADAHWFGCSVEMAEANLAACRVWREAHVRPLQGKQPAAWAALDFRADRVTSMWRDLVTALNEKEPAESRLAALRELRWLLGDEAYFTGRIHSPIPPKGP